MRRLQRTIEEIGWTRDVPTLTGDAPVARALASMREEAHDCALVTDGDRLIGIFTSRDFLNRVADPGSADTLPVGAVMTPRPRTLRPRDPLAFAINWMALEAFRNVPIVDDDGRVLGALTVWDVMRHLTDVFDEIDATPRDVPAADDRSGPAVLDLGGGA